MNIYYELSRDHRYFEQLLERLSKCREEQAAERKFVLDELCAQLVAHAHAEERVLHVALRDGITRGLMAARVLGNDATVHTELQDVALHGLSAESRAFVVARINRHVREHIREEERYIYTAARSVFSEAEAVELGEAFHRVKQHALQNAEVQD